MFADTFIIIFMIAVGIAFVSAAIIGTVTDEIGAYFGLALVLLGSCFTSLGIAFWYGLSIRSAMCFIFTLIGLLVGILGKVNYAIARIWKEKQEYVLWMLVSISLLILGAFTWLNANEGVITSLLFVFAGATFAIYGRRGYKLNLFSENEARALFCSSILPIVAGILIFFGS